jgi:CheY-like chemotaxis protein
MKSDKVKNHPLGTEGMLRHAFLEKLDGGFCSPLNGILHLTRRLLDEKPAPAQRESLEVIHRSGTLLLDALNDLHDLARIENGELEIDAVEFNLASALETISAPYKEQALHDNLILDIEADPRIPPILVGDPGRLRQLLCMLLGDAVKHAAGERISLNVSLTEAATETAVIRFELQSAYVGLNGLEEPELRFASCLVELLGGKIEHLSEPGDGMIVCVDLPFKVSADGRLTNRQPVKELDLDGLPVLVVDNDPGNLNRLQRMLRAGEMKPAGVTHGETAVQALERAADKGKPFAVTIIDWFAPPRGGTELADEIKCNPAIDDVHVIMLNSAGQRGDAARCRKIGVAGYLPRPVIEADLIETIRTVIGRSEGEPGESPLVTRHYIQENQSKKDLDAGDGEENCFALETDETG